MYFGGEVYEHQNSRFHNYPDLALRFTETTAETTSEGTVHTETDCTNAHNEEIVEPLSFQFWMYLLFCFCKSI